MKDSTLTLELLDDKGAPERAPLLCWRSSRDALFPLGMLELEHHPETELRETHKGGEKRLVETNAEAARFAELVDVMLAGKVRTWRMTIAAGSLVITQNAQLTGVRRHPSGRWEFVLDAPPPPRPTTSFVRHIPDEEEPS